MKAFVATFSVCLALIWALIILLSIPVAALALGALIALAAAAAVSVLTSVIAVRDERLEALEMRIQVLENQPAQEQPAPDRLISERKTQI